MRAMPPTKPAAGAGAAVSPSHGLFSVQRNWGMHLNNVIFILDYLSYIQLWNI